MSTNLRRSQDNSAVSFNDTRISLNIPVGVQRKLTKGLGWFGEMKLVIADDEVDSSFRFSFGLMFGSGD